MLMDGTLLLYFHMFLLVSRCGFLMKGLISCCGFPHARAHFLVLLVVVLLVVVLLVIVDGHHPPLPAY